MSQRAKLRPLGVPPSQWRDQNAKPRPTKDRECRVTTAVDALDVQLAWLFEHDAVIDLRGNRIGLTMWPKDRDRGVTVFTELDPATIEPASESTEDKADAALREAYALAANVRGVLLGLVSRMRRELAPKVEVVSAVSAEEERQLRTGGPSEGADA